MPTATTSVMPTYARADLVFERGEGAWLFTPEGEKYLDFGAGVAVTALGHAHPALVEALQKQAGALWHTSNLYRIEGQERLAKRLTGLSFAEVVFFANSGAEAMECSIKMARKYQSACGKPERYRLITFEGAFHGRTLATISAGASDKHREGFGPAVEGFDRVPFGDIEAVRGAITNETAGIVIEPLQGEGGIRTVPWSFLRELRALCDEHDLMLVFDEVQTGIGRTGRLFAHEWSGVSPDIMALAKGLGGGFPVGACLATAEAAKGMTAGTHGSTFGGNLLAMAVGNAVLDEVTKPGFLEHVQAMSLRLKQKLAAICDENSGLIEEVRGEGLLLGLKCRASNADVLAAAQAHGLLLVGAGENVVRFLPPLIVGEAEIDEACDRLSAALATLSPAARAAG